MRTKNNIIQHLTKGHTAVIMAVCLFASCATDTAYHRFEHVSEEGWDKRDTFFFKTDTIVKAGLYTTTLCIRTDADYPYRNLTVRTAMIVRPDNNVKTNTVDFDIIKEDGMPDGDGITYYTYERTLDTLHLTPGDSILIKVAHNMRRETMPGVADVGIKVSEIK